MRKFILLALVLALLTLCACGHDTVSPETTEAVTTRPPETTEAITTAPPETTEAVNIPEATQPAKALSAGTISGDRYDNPDINLSYRLTDGWEFATNEEIQTMNGLSQPLSREDISQYIEDTGEAVIIMSASNGIDNLNVGCRNMKTDNAADISVMLLQTAIERKDWASMGMVLKSCESSKVDFLGESVDKLVYVAEWSAYDVSVCGTTLFYSRGHYVVEINFVTSAAAIVDRQISGFSRYNEERSLSRDSLQASMDSLSDILDKYADETSADGKTYRLSGLPGTIQIPDNYHVYSLDNPFTEEMCRAQGQGYSNMTTYLSLSGEDMIIVPENDPYPSASFEISIRIKDSKEYGVTNLSRLDDSTLHTFASALTGGFILRDDRTADYELYKTGNTTYIVFECTMPAPQRRYATIINGKMVYFIAEANGQYPSQTQDEALRSIIDTLEYSG